MNDDGYQFMLSAVQAAYSEDDLRKLIAAAADDQWLKDNDEGAVRVMDIGGREAGRPSRDPSNWKCSRGRPLVDGCFVIMYGPNAIRRVRTFLGDNAPEAEVLPHVEDEKAELAEVDVEDLCRHKFKKAWQLKWLKDEGRFSLVQSEVPQLWWAVAQNVIVPLKCCELANKYPDVYGAVLADERNWGAAGHLAWALSKTQGDNLKADPMYGACMASSEPLSTDGWPAGLDPALGWPAEELEAEATLMAQPDVVRAIAAKWGARKYALFAELHTKDEQVIEQANLRRIRSDEQATIRPGTADAEAARGGKGGADTGGSSSAQQQHLRAAGFVALLVTREESETAPEKPGRLQAAVSSATGFGKQKAPRAGAAAISISSAAAAAAAAAASAVNSAVQTAGLVVQAPLKTGVGDVTDQVTDAVLHNPVTRGVVGIAENVTNAATSNAITRAVDRQVTGIGKALDQEAMDREAGGSLGSSMPMDGIHEGGDGIDEAVTNRCLDAKQEWLKLAEKRKDGQWLPPERGGSSSVDKFIKEKTFKITFGQLANVSLDISHEKARRRAMELRCVRTRKNADGKVVRDKDDNPVLDRYPFCHIEGMDDFLLDNQDMTDETAYGLPVAIVIYLRMHMLCAATLLLMFCCSLPEMLVNMQRANDRHDCRELLRGDTYEAMTDGNATFHATDYDYTGYERGYLEEWRAKCAFVGLPMRRGELMPAFSLLRSTSLGACMDYATTSNNTQPVLDFEDFADVTSDDLFNRYYEDLKGDQAVACVSESESWYAWLSLLNVCLFASFIAILKLTSRHVARIHDKNNWTAADYAVMIKGLKVGVPADRMTTKDPVTGETTTVEGLEAQLLEDLAELGFGHDIDHVELGRTCKEEGRLQRQYDALMKLESEIDARRQRFKRENEDWKARAAAPTTSEDRDYVEDTKDHGEVWDRISKTQKELETVRAAGMKTTGHAFVCFKVEDRRDEFVKLMERTDWLESLVAACLGRSSPPPPPLSCAENREFHGIARLFRANKGAVVTDAPEPKDIYWENLELDGSAYQREQQFVTRVVTFLIIVFGLLISISVKIVTDVFSQGLENKTDTASQVKITIASLIEAGVISGINLLLKAVIPPLARREGFSTYVSYETSVFTSLSVAYVLNTGFLPLCVGLFPFLRITQAWYEEGGVVSQSMILMLAAGTGFPIEQAVQPLALFNRYVRARYAKSQNRLDFFYEPPPILFAKLYASTVKAISLCMLFAPIFPLAYPLTAILLFFAFGCYKFGLSFWFRRPKPLGNLMMDRLCDFLGAVLVCHVIIAYVAQSEARQDQMSDSQMLNVLIVALLLWLVSQVAIRVQHVLRDRTTHPGTTGGIVYSEVPAKKGYPIDRYVCPAAAKNRQLRDHEEEIVEAFKSRHASMSKSRTRELGAADRASKPSQVVPVDDSIERQNAGDMSVTSTPDTKGEEIKGLGD